MEEKKKLDPTHVGMLIDAPIEMFTEAVQDYDFGVLVSVKKMLELEYNKVETLVNQIVEKLKVDTISAEQKLASEKTLESLYVALQLIEDRCAVLETLKLEKGVLN